MNWYSRLAAFLIVLALVGCDQAQYAPYSPDDNGSMHDSGGGGNGGGM